LAATYSRGIYKTTTIGKAAFDGRVRNGNGSDHSFMTTKVSVDDLCRFIGQGCGFGRRFVQHLNFKEHSENDFGYSLKTTHRLLAIKGYYNSRVKIAFCLQPKLKKEAIKPHDRLVSVR
jgi:hypothetical protein